MFSYRLGGIYDEVIAHATTSFRNSRFDFTSWRVCRE